MTNIGSYFKDAFAETVKYGQQVRFKYYDTSFGAGSYYNDDATLTYSGTTWESGVVQPLDKSQGSSEAMLVQQGQLLTDDSKVYIAGAVQTSGTMKIGLGSPPSAEYFVIENGVIDWTINAESIYKKIYIRQLTTGSLIGET